VVQLLQYCQFRRTYCNQVEARVRLHLPLSSTLLVLHPSEYVDFMMCVSLGSVEPLCLATDSSALPDYATFCFNELCDLPRLVELDVEVYMSR